MEIKDLDGKLVAVLGYGIEGMAVANYLLKHGVKPTLFDQKPWEEWPGSEQDEIKNLGLNFIFGPDCFKELTGFDVAFRSPGIRLKTVTSDPDSTTNKLVDYGAGKLQVTSQAKWFFEHCPAKIIGVTGTKGKGTTSALIYEMLNQEVKSKKLKVKSYLTGNIGKIQPLDFLDNLSEDDWVIYELSSFQLQDLTVSPHIGVVLMVTKEHMDYHTDIKEYHDSKTAIVKFQSNKDFAIINNDYPASQAIGAFGKGKKLFFSRIKKSDCYIQKNSIVVANSDFRFPTPDLQLRGEHNLENVCAAILVATCAKCKSPAIKIALKEFKGLEHRLEFVTEKNGIKFYNDSFSTTPETAIAAIKSFNEPKILILGGSSKNSDFSELAEILVSKNNIKALVLIGKEAGKIKDSISKAGDFKGRILEGAKNMTGVFNQIKTVAGSGDVVLLSPACASFDMFKNYQDRGQQFKEEALKW